MFRKDKSNSYKPVDIISGALLNILNKHNTNVPLNIGKTLSFKSNNKIVIGSNLNLKKNQISGLIVETELQFVNRRESAKLESMDNSYKRSKEQKLVSQRLKYNENENATTKAIDANIVAFGTKYSATGYAITGKATEHEIVLYDNKKNRINYDNQWLTSASNPTFKLDLDSKHSGSIVEIQSLDKNGKLLNIIARSTTKKDGSVNANTRWPLKEGSYNIGYKIINKFGATVVSNDPVLAQIEL